MKKIEMEFNHISKNKKIGLVKIIGEVELSNIDKFSNFIKQVLESPCKKLIFDLKELKYMNSAGFGLLASIAIENADKKIFICNMHPTILKIYNIFGMEKVCKNFASVQEALQTINSAKGQSFEKLTFPLIRSCHNCSQSSKFPKPGHYKCPFCEAIHFLNEEGELKLVKAPKIKKEDKGDLGIDKIDITLLSDKNYLSKMRDFIFSFIDDKFNEDERSSLAMAVDEACSNAIEHAHKEDRSKKIHMGLEITPSKFSITIEDSGINTFNKVIQKGQNIQQGVNQNKVKATGRGMGLILIRQMMDEVDLKPTQSWGTAITMTKYFSKE